MKTFCIDLNVCTGCHGCQLGCKDEHCGNCWLPYAAEQPDTGQFWMNVKQYERGARPHVKVTYIPTPCQRCEDAPCMKVAKDGAMYRRDDGMPIMKEELVREAMLTARRLKLPLSFHEEDPQYITEPGVNHGDVAGRMGLTGADRKAESTMVARDCKLARETGATIVIQHISAKESVDLVRKAKKNGVRVFAEATPHHFTLTEEAVSLYGTNAKMNPPLRTEEDRQAIIEGLKDGTIDVIATDHAPHSKSEKDRPFTQAPSGIIGLETAFALGMMNLVAPGHLTLSQLISKMSTEPARLYALEAGAVREDGPADIILFDPEKTWAYLVPQSKATNSPWLGKSLKGKVVMTICGGQIAYEDTRAFGERRLPIGAKLKEI